MATCPQPNVEALMSDLKSDLQRTRNRLPVERSVAASAPNDLPGNGTVGCKRMSGESNSALFARHYARHPARSAVPTNITAGLQERPHPLFRMRPFAVVPDGKRGKCG